MNEDFLLIIDGSSLLSTQFYGNLPREILFAKTVEEKEKYFHKIMMTRKGRYTNAVYGFLRTLFKILDEQKPKYLAVCWDLTRDTFRRKIYPEYKGNRSETLEPLKEQFATCQDALRRIGVRQFMSMEYEADDYAGSLCKRFEQEVPVKVYTKDHDYLQLVTNRTHMWLMHASAEKTEELYKKYRIDHKAVNVPDRAFELDPDLVLKEFGVLPENVNSLKGLQGDSVDNIKGVPGVGEVTAVKLIHEYHTVDALYEALRDLDKKKEAELKKFWKEELGIGRAPISFLLKESDTELVGEKAARLSELLATIKTDIDLDPLTLSDLSVNISLPDTEAVLSDLEISSISTAFLSDSEENHPEEHFRTEDDFSALSGLSDEFRKESSVGLYYIPDVGLAISKENGESVFIPEQFFVNADTLREFLSKVLPGKEHVYCFSGKTLIKAFQILPEDVGLMAYLLDPLKGKYPYEAVAKEYLQKTVKSEQEWLGKVNPETAKLSIPDALRNYMCDAAWTSVHAGPVLLRMLSEQGMERLLYDIELPCMQALSDMEDTGICVKREELETYGRKLQLEISRLEQEIYDLTGEKFNINSPKQLAEILFEKLQLPYGKKGKGGYSTAADILEKLAPDYPVVSKILEYRTYTKLKSTYADGLAACISGDGRIHGTFNQTITATGRISSTNPNLQNIPVRLELGREIRKVFIPKPGCIFIDADYSQIELRVLAHLSGDENLIAAYRNAKDIHAATASQVFGVPLSEVTPLMRRNAKAVNFGIVYGMSAFGLSEDLSISRADAKEYIENYFAAYPKIEGYLKSQVEQAKELGYTTTMFGRRRPIPELLSASFQQRSFGERAAMNSPIQGTAADIMKIAMVRVAKRLREENLQARIVLQVHDELLLEVPEAEADHAEQILTSEMEHAAVLSVKLETEAKRGYSWYETK